MTLEPRIVKKGEHAGKVAHPAKYSDPILDVVAARLPELLAELPPREDGGELILLDSFAGTGKVHKLADEYGLPVSTLGIEIEPEWASYHERTMVGDALHLTNIATGAIDLEFASPQYGNRLADHQDPKDGSVRHGYKFYLGRDVSPASSCALPWGPKYRAWHEDWLREQLRVIRQGGYLGINIKNFYVDKGATERRVTEFFLNAAMMLGCSIECVDRIPVPGLAHGTNWEQRVATEKVLWLRTPTEPQQRLL